MLIDTKVTEYPVTKTWEKGNEELTRFWRVGLENNDLLL